MPADSDSRRNGLGRARAAVILGRHRLATPFASKMRITASSPAAGVTVASPRAKATAHVEAVQIDVVVLAAAAVDRGRR